MPRRAAKVDANQPEIVAYLRAHGFSVEHLHMVGEGCPDIMVGRDEVNYLIEIKVPGEKLNERQVKWHGKWRGQKMTVWCVEDLEGIV